MDTNNIIAIAGILEVLILAFVGYLMTRLSSLETEVKMLNNEYLKSITSLNLKMDNIEKYIHEQKHLSANKDAHMTMLTERILTELEKLKANKVI